MSVFEIYTAKDSNLWHFPEAANQSFKRGELVYLDNNGQVAVCSSDPSEILGIAAQDATGTQGSDIMVHVLYPDTEVKAVFSTTPAQTDVGQKYGVAVSSNSWTVDKTETAKPRVRVKEVLDTTDKTIVVTFLDNYLYTTRNLIYKNDFANEVKTYSVYTLSGSFDNQTVDVVKLYKGGTVVAVTYFTAAALDAGTGIDVINGGQNGIGTNVICSSSDALNGKESEDTFDSTYKVLAAGDWLRVKFDDYTVATFCVVTITIEHQMNQL
jgi:hypothetical protein